MKEPLGNILLTICAYVLVCVIFHIRCAGLIAKYLYHSKMEELVIILNKYQLMGTNKNDPIRYMCTLKLNKFARLYMSMKLFVNHFWNYYKGSVFLAVLFLPTITTFAVVRFINVVSALEDFSYGTMFEEALNFSLYLIQLYKFYGALQYFEGINDSVCLKYLCFSFFYFKLIFIKDMIFIFKIYFFILNY